MMRRFPGSGLFRRLSGDRSGVSAVEFALIAPIIIAFYFGLAEFCQAYMAQKRMGHVSSVVADLITQGQSTSAAEIDDIFQVGALIMRPYSASSLHQRVSHITRGNDGVLRLDWSRGSGMAALTGTSALSVPDGIIGNNESVLMTEVTYDYASPVDDLLPGITEFSNRYFLRPRTVDRITYVP